MRSSKLTSRRLIGHWSHGLAHDYGGSHDFSLIFLADGRGAFIHDGWWTYRVGSFRWRLRRGELVLTSQRFWDPDGWMGNRCLQIAGPVVASFDPVQKRERLDILLLDEPNDYYLVTREVGEKDLQLEHLPRGDVA